MDSLAQNITIETDNDSLKIWKIYDWVCSNITYDNQLKYQDWYKLKDTLLYRSQQPDVILIRKKAICEGYARLFKALCNTVQIPCELIEGFVKENGFFNNEKHAWNIVKLHNQWYFIDATWGTANKLNYFLQSPSKMTNSHLPDDPLWQLTTTPISFDYFQKYKIPKYYAENFVYQDTLDSYFKLDTLAQFLNKINRVLDYNPHHKGMLLDAADFYFEQGIAQYSRYIDIVNTNPYIKRNESQLIVCKNILLAAEQSFILAERYYTILLAYYKKYKITNIHINHFNCTENLKEVQAQLSFIKN